jgi:large subunit ribosomal protein L4
MVLPILNSNGTETGRTVTLSDEIFNIEPNDHVIYLDVKQFLANQRQGTHKTKQRSEVARSTRKIKKQKGTGGARAGSLKNPQFKGGGRIFGPTPRDYRFKLNKKVKRLARRSALTYKAKESAIRVLENPTFNAPKTKEYIKLLSNLALTGKKTLLVLNDRNDNIALSARNLQKARVSQVTTLNTYEILNADVIIFAEGSVEKLNELLDSDNN